MIAGVLDLPAPQGALAGGGDDPLKRHVVVFVLRLDEKIPASQRVQWVENLRATMKAMTWDGDIAIGTGCSGTDIVAHALATLRLYWRKEYNVSGQRLRHDFAAECDSSKPRFLDGQHNINFMLDNVELLTLKALKDIRI